MKIIILRMKLFSKKTRICQFSHTNQVLSSICRFDFKSASGRQWRFPERFLELWSFVKKLLVRLCFHVFWRKVKSMAKPKSFKCARSWQQCKASSCFHAVCLIWKSFLSRNHLKTLFSISLRQMGSCERGLWTKGPDNWQIWENYQRDFVICSIIDFGCSFW